MLLLPLIVAKKVLPVAVKGTERLTALPDVPTAAELGYPDMVMENRYGLLTPAGLAPDTAAKLDAAALAGIKLPRLQQAMKDGEIKGALDAKGFKARLDHDVAFWRPMIKKLGIAVAN